MLLSYLAFVLVIAPLACSFLGFLIGKAGDRSIRARLVDFYVVVHGDWKQLYQGPARLCFDYMTQMFGRSRLTALLFIALYSVITTCLLMTLHLNLAIPEGVDSAGPVLTGSGAFDLDAAVRLYLAPNLAGDLIAWTVALWCLRRLRQAGVLGAICLAAAIMVSSTLSFVLVARLERWGWYWAEPFDLTLPFVGEGGYPTQEFIALSNALSQLGLPVSGFTFDYWGAIPAAVFLPAILFGVTTLLAVVIVILRPILGRLVLACAERLDESDKSVLQNIAAALVAVAVLFTAVRVLMAS